MNDPLTHLDGSGRARMVDVGAKAETAREATAGCVIHMEGATLQRILDGGIAKGDVLAVAQVAGVMAAKRTSDLIPLCHPLPITGVELDYTPQAATASLAVTARVRVTGKTGVEMEALTAVTVAALTVYDMCKAIDRGMTIDQVRLLAKRGGKSGEFRRSEE